jgi:hypothetical protein
VRAARAGSAARDLASTPESEAGGGDGLEVAVAWIMQRGADLGGQPAERAVGAVGPALQVGGESSDARLAGGYMEAPVGVQAR